MISSRDLDDLLPAVKLRALIHIEACKKAGIDLLVYCTYRDGEAQNALYAQGRTISGNIITNAKAGESFHNFKMAYDCVPLVGGKPAWNNLDLYTRVGRIGKDCGLDWAGDWHGSLRETAHFQYTGGLTLSDLRVGKTLA